MAEHGYVDSTEAVVQVPADVAKALYQRLLTPEKDKYGCVVYTVPITLASELRKAIAAGR